MKKLCFLLIALFFIISCSSDDSNTNSQPILLTEIVETVNYNGNIETHTYNFSYDGNRIISQYTENYQILFTYSGSLITKIEYLNNNTISHVEEFVYNSDQELINFKRFEYENNLDYYGQNVDYAHNSDGTVSYIKNTGFLPNLTDTSTGTINFNSEGLVETIVSSTGYTKSYVYDSKNNPYKNILGIEKILFTSDDGSSLIRNLITKVETDSFSTYTVNSTYTYNTNDFPTESISNDGYETVTRQYTYNQ